MMDDIYVGKLLPNLKVSIGNDGAESVSSNVQEHSSNLNIEVIRPNLQEPKIYKNKDGGFITNIDLIAEEKSGILHKRAERFGLPTEQKPNITPLYHSLGIDITNRDSVSMKNIRLKVLHIRGVDKLDTDDVLDYFHDYFPAYVEWINDSSCNVVWHEESGPVRALLALSKPLQSSFPLENKNSQENSVCLSTSEEDNKKHTEEMEVDTVDTLDKSLIDIPVPPGQWRVATSCPKAETLLLRFATTADKKIPGAEKRSDYYKKYGNPNFGGMKGLISTSRKHKIQGAANRSVVKLSSNFQESSVPKINFDESEPKVHKQKKLRMRMYADDEESKAKKPWLNPDFRERSSVHSRLGKKYTSKELHSLGKYKDVHDDDDINPFSREKSSDLRAKLKKKRQGDERVRETFRVNVEDTKHSRVYALKREDEKYFKRKHRSPLCQDDTDTDSSCDS